MGSIGKAVGNVGGSIVKGVKKIVDINKKVFTPSKWFKDNMPDPPKNPLMPDYDLIEKERKRRRMNKMGRTETIMSSGSDTLG
jgi:hypothetical protein